MLMPGAAAISLMMRGVTFTSLYMAWCNTSFLFDKLLTDMSFLFFRCKEKAKSSIIQKSVYLCGAATIGNIFKFSVGLCLMLCYVNLRIIDKVTLENLCNPTYAVIMALNSPRSAPIEGIQPSVDQDVSNGKVLSKWR